MNSPKLPPRAVVDLDRINQRLSELDQSIQFVEQQLEQSSIALAVIKELSSSNNDKELLVPIGGGVFITVSSSAVLDVKLAVGAGVVVDKSPESALSFVQKQFDDLQDYYQRLLTTYELTVQKARQLQDSIEMSS